MIYFIVALLVLALDQISKWFVVKEMYLGQSIPIIDGVFYLTSHRNAGAAFGILQNQRLFFVIITIVVVLGVIYYLYKIKNTKPLWSWALAFILGGALGNFIDRLLTGQVVDFLDVKIKIGSFYYDYPIFNIADSALVLGIGILIVDTLIESIKDKKSKKLSS